MSKIKKIIAALSASAIILSLVGCGKDLTWSAKIENTTFTPGTYIYYTINGYNDAINKLPKGKKEKDLFDVKIEDKNAKDYIKDYATESLKECIAIEKEFKNQGLELSDYNKKEISLTVDNTINKNEEQFKELGIARKSIEYVVTSNKMYELLFNKYYDKGGIYEVPQSDIDAKLKSDYAYVRLISKSLKDSDGKALTDDKKKEIEDELNADIVKIKSGETTYMDLYDENMKAINGDKYVVSDEDKANEDRAKQIISKDNSAYLSETLIDSLLKADDDSLSVVKEDDYYYLVEKYSMVNNEELSSKYRSIILNSLKSDEFESKVKDLAKDIKIEKNNAVYKKYDPKDIPTKIAKANKK